MWKGGPPLFLENELLSQSAGSSSPGGHELLRSQKGLRLLSHCASVGCPGILNLSKPILQVLIGVFSHLLFVPQQVAICFEEGAFAFGKLLVDSSEQTAPVPALLRGK